MKVGKIFECLSTHWFSTLDDARSEIKEWRNDYNGFRRHDSLSGVTANEFLALQQNRPKILFLM
jgi:putative transposase